MTTVHRVAENGRLAVLGDVAVHFALPTGARHWAGERVKATFWNAGPSAFETWEAGDATYLFDFDIQILWDPSDEELGAIAAKLLELKTNTFNGR